jgi:hypothetical protein
MSDDLTQTQDQSGEGWRRAREVSLLHRMPPSQVPGYEIERCLGEGAYGEVWVAKDKNNPGRRVAIKFYTRRGGEWALLTREVEKLNFLATDRYVVQLIDIGWNADPPYYVMEYMENGSLAERVAAGPLPVKEAVALFREVARGVVNAHNRGVLHCDLKPANVLLGLDGKPRLADFGQSRLSNEQVPALGTLFYMAPEQADSKGTPDTRWDVYALGSLLYCLVTGEPPYRDVPGVSALEEAVPLDERLARYRRLLEQSPRPRKHRSCPGMDRALAEIIDRCLAVNPARRYPNVQAVLNALDARALRRARRPLLVLGAVGPLLLLLVMGGLVAQELATAVKATETSLLEQTRISNQFAAQSVAEKVAGRIDRRWRALEQEASDPRLQRLLKAARGKRFGSPEQKALQMRLHQVQKAHTKDVAAEAWSVFDESGILLARSPRNDKIDQFVGKNYAQKDFFNGLDQDLDVIDLLPQFRISWGWLSAALHVNGVSPLDHAHRSKVFESNITHTRKVAFSVPIWDGKASGDQPPMGVLIMTVEIGGFAELQPDEEGSKIYVTTLVDRRPDATGKAGAILEHPLLAQMRSEGVPEKNLQFFADLKQFDGSEWDSDYTDPLGAEYPDYRCRWLAAEYPVIVDEREEGGDTGWVVIVQEKYDLAIGPVLKLQKDMLKHGLWALAVALSVVTILWLFVILVLNESTQSRLFSFLRRRAGVTGESLASTRASLARSSKPAPPAQPAPPTVTEPPR